MGFYAMGKERLGGKQEKKVVCRAVNEERRCGGAVVVVYGKRVRR